MAIDKAKQQCMHKRSKSVGGDDLRPNWRYGHW